jgi:hypothetical protein
MTAEGMQLEIVNNSSNQRSRETMTWEQVFAKKVGRDALESTMETRSAAEERFRRAYALPLLGSNQDSPDPVSRLPTTGPFAP